MLWQTAACLVRWLTLKLDTSWLPGVPVACMVDWKRDKEVTCWQTIRSDRSIAVPPADWLTLTLLLSEQLTCCLVDKQVHSSLGKYSTETWQSVTQNEAGLISIYCVFKTVNVTVLKHWLAHTDETQVSIWHKQRTQQAERERESRWWSNDLPT